MSLSILSAAAAASCRAGWAAAVLCCCAGQGGGVLWYAVVCGRLTRRGTGWVVASLMRVFGREERKDIQQEGRVCWCWSAGGNMKGRGVRWREDNWRNAKGRRRTSGGNNFPWRHGIWSQSPKEPRSQRIRTLRKFRGRELSAFGWRHVATQKPGFYEEKRWAVDTTEN